MRNNPEIIISEPHNSEEDRWDIVYAQVIEPYIDTVKLAFRDTVDDMCAQAIDTHYYKHQELHQKSNKRSPKR